MESPSLLLSNACSSFSVQGDCMVGNHGNTFPSNRFLLKMEKPTYFGENLKENTKLLFLYEKDHNYSMSIYQNICLKPQIRSLPWKLLLIYVKCYTISSKSNKMIYFSW